VATMLKVRQQIVRGCETFPAAKLPGLVIKEIEPGRAASELHAVSTRPATTRPRTPSRRPGPEGPRRPGRTGSVFRRSLRGKCPPTNLTYGWRAYWWRRPLPSPRHEPPDRSHALTGGAAGPDRDGGCGRDNPDDRKRRRQDDHGPERRRRRGEP